MNRGDLVLFFIAALLGGGAYFFLRSVKAGWNKYRASADWATTQVRIMHAEIVSGGDSEGYQPDIQYSYVVNGKKYQGDQVWFGAKTSSSFILWTAKKVVSRYPVGASVSIFYNPDDPQEAILERKFVWTEAILGLLCIFSILVIVLPVISRILQSSR